MWQKRKFKTRKALESWLDSQAGKIQYRELFVNNAYCVEYRKLRQL